MLGNLRELPIDKRIQLVEDLWDSIAADGGAVSLSDEQRTELDRRLDDYEANGIKGRKAANVLADVRKRL